MSENNLVNSVRREIESMEKVSLVRFKDVLGKEEFSALQDAVIVMENIDALDISDLVASFRKDTMEFLKALIAIREEREDNE